MDIGKQDVIFLSSSNVLGSEEEHILSHSTRDYGWFQKKQMTNILFLFLINFEMSKLVKNFVSL